MHFLLIIFIVFLLFIAVCVFYYIYRDQYPDDSCENVMLPAPPCCGRALNLRSQILGGIKVRERELPFMANIGQFGGTLINSRWVLTAAHCMEFKPKVVYLGTLSCTKNKGCDSSAKEVEIKKRIPHEKFDDNHDSYDIALLQLKDSVAFSDSIYPICLPINANVGENIIQKMARVAGWGSTKADGKMSNSLLSINVAIWDPKKCEAFDDFDEFIKSEHHICAGGTSNIDSCTGDSGGPLFMQLPPVENQVEDPSYQIGIVSFGSPVCGQKGHPGAYTNISTFIPWIKKTIEANP